MKKAVTLFLCLVFMHVCIFTQIYQLKGKLVCEKGDCNLPPHCGYIAFAKAFKLEVINTTYETTSKNIICIVPCPEFYGQVFFVHNRIYDIEITTENTHIISYSVMNDFSEEKLPTFWATSVKPDIISK
jgi:hypothetical protein